MFVLHVQCILLDISTDPIQHTTLTIHVRIATHIIIKCQRTQTKVNQKMYTITKICFTVLPFGRTQRDLNKYIG